MTASLRINGKTHALDVSAETPLLWGKLHGYGASSVERSFEERTGVQEKVMTTKRDLFDELTEGFYALEAQRAGKRTLRTHSVKAKPAPKVTAHSMRKAAGRL
jgi:hypothetical protein